MEDILKLLEQYGRENKLDLQLKLFCDGSGTVISFNYKYGIKEDVIMQFSNLDDLRKQLGLQEKLILELQSKMNGNDNDIVDFILFAIKGDNCKVVDGYLVELFKRGWTKQKLIEYVKGKQ